MGKTKESIALLFLVCFAWEFGEAAGGVLLPNRAPAMRAPIKSPVVPAAEPQPRNCEAGSKKVRVTHYFSGPAATKGEGTKSGLGQRDLPMIPCHSVACGSGTFGKEVYLPQLIGLKCSGSTPFGDANKLMEGDVSIEEFPEILRKNSKRAEEVFKKMKGSNRQLLAGAKDHVKCDGKVCTNISGKFRCQDTGDDVSSRQVDIYAGNCFSNDGHGACTSDAAAAAVSDEYPLNQAGTKAEDVKVHTNSVHGQILQRLASRKQGAKGGVPYAQKCDPGSVSGTSARNSVQ